MARYDLESVVGGRTACSGSCGNMAARGVSAAGSAQRRGVRNGDKGTASGRSSALGAGEGVRNDGAAIQRRGPRVAGDASRSAGVAGDEIAM